MYGQGSGVVGGAASTTAGVAALPKTGGSPLLMVVSIAAIVLGVTAIVVQLAVMSYRRQALKQQ